MLDVIWGKMILMSLMLHFHFMENGVGEVLVQILGLVLLFLLTQGKSLIMLSCQQMCEVCKAGETLRNNPEKYQKWMESYESSGLCQKNYKGSSSSTEKDAARILWGRSVDLHEFRYHKNVFIGDSFAYSDVLDIYGVAMTVKNIKKMNRK